MFSASLGQLVGELLKDGTSVQSLAASAQFEISSSDVDVTLPYFSFRLQRGVPDEQYLQLSNELMRFTEQRNELVHHFLERFDLQTADSCSAAEIYLDDAYSVFKNHLDQLKDWQADFQKSRQELATLLDSPEFTNHFLHGILPDGSVDWEYSSIVRSLMKAWQEQNLNGWNKLDHAIASIKKREPDLSPALFGCKTWRQVLNRSKLFEVRLDQNANTGRGECWFRPKIEIEIEQYG